VFCSAAFAHICDLPPGEARMLVDDDIISEDIDLADSDDGFADVKRIELPAFYARQNILIEELARVVSATWSHQLNFTPATICVNPRPGVYGRDAIKRRR
jgi:hypothetical protein